MSEQRKQILTMLAEGKITADEAERLIQALEADASPRPEKEEPDQDQGERKKPKYFHVKVEGGHGRHENVDIKIPIMLLKAGVKLGSIMPGNAKAKFSKHFSHDGMDFDLDDLDGEKLDELLKTLGEASIDIDADDEKVRIFCK